METKVAKAGSAGTDFYSHLSIDHPNKNAFCSDF